MKHIVPILSITFLAGGAIIALLLFLSSVSGGVPDAAFNLTALACAAVLATCGVVLWRVAALPHS